MKSDMDATQVQPVKLDERSIKTAQPGDVLYDANVTGLHLRCFPQTKGFYLYYRTKAGQPRRPKLGNHGALTLTQARKAAQEMLAQVAAGHDPAMLRYDARLEPTFAELWAEFRKRRGEQKKSAQADEGNYRRYLEKRFGSKKLSAIGYPDIADLMENLADKPIQANRVLALLSVMFNFAKAPLRWIKDSPCDGVRRYPETKRRRYMKGDEAAKIAEALDKRAEREPAGVAFIYLLILTGARKGEVAAARWDWLDGNRLNLPDSKTGEKSVYLPQPALDVLAKLPRTAGTIVGIADPKKLWWAVRKEAGCEDLRLHDLRHSFASAALAAGLSLSQIGELLGHKSTQTTKRYAHLVEEAAHAAATVTADRIMLGLRKEKTPA